MRNLFLLFFVVFSLTACQEKYDHMGKKPVARVGSSFLYSQDVNALIPLSLSKIDSTNFVTNYCKQWVKRKLFLAKAEQNIPYDGHIEQMVSDYRQSLLLHVYQQQLMDQKFTEQVTEEETKDYYQQNGRYFILQRPIVKGLFMKVPISLSTKKLERWLQSDKQESLDLVEQFSLQKAVIYENFYEKWLLADDIVERMPFKKMDKERLFSAKQFIELKDTAYCYYLIISEYSLEGAPEPYDFARTKIADILLKTKQVAFIEKTKQELYERSLKNNDVEYY